MAVMRLSTADVAPQERFELWYDVTTNSHVPMAIDSAHRDDFRATTELHDLGPVHISRLSYPALTARRTAQHIRRSDPEMLQVSLGTSGRQLSQWAGGEAMADRGDLIVYDTSRAGTIINSGPISHLVLQVPRALLGVRRSGIDSLLNTPLPTRDGLGGVLAYLMTDLFENAHNYPPAVVAQLSATAVDLLTVAAGIAGGATRTTSPESRGRIRTAQILRFIRQRLDDPELTPDTVARGNGLSPRQLNRVFEAEGSSPADWIRRQRLERCRQDLLDPSQAARTVVSIGAGWGFPDPVTFNRAFRREFGLPPGEYRRLHTCHE